MGQDRFDGATVLGRHRTAQIATDGSEKVPKRWLGAAERAASTGQDTGAFELALAFWVRWCAGRRDDGSTFAIDDPRAEALRAAGASGDGRERVEAVVGALGWRDAPFVGRPAARAAVGALVQRLLDDGVDAVVRVEGAAPR